MPFARSGFPFENDLAVSVRLARLCAISTSNSDLLKRLDGAMMLRELAIADKRPVRFLNQRASCSARKDGSANRSCVKLNEAFSTRNCFAMKSQT